ncbi:hypothetical protein BC629DRAFT_1291799 [Irpex lacteus]|nr:hypothetical protein BC629DRAFT_1291799 [Irpex lacteus]
MATVTHYIRSHYDPKDREALELATGQISTTIANPDAGETPREEAEIDPWQTEKAFGIERRLAAAPRFVPAAISYDEVNNMLGGMPRAVLQPPVEERKEDVSVWYRSLTGRSHAGSAKVQAGQKGEKIQQNVVASSASPSPSHTRVSVSTPSSSTTRPRPDKNSWFITRALQSELAPAPPPTLPTLADILAREPPVPKKPVEPPVFLALGPSNKGWGMLQQKGWSEGEGLGANVIRRTEREQRRAAASSSQGRLEVEDVKVKMERQEVQLDSDGEISEMREVEVVDLTLSDSDDEVVQGEDEATTEHASSAPPFVSRASSPHSKPLLTPIPTILKSDRLGIGLKAKKTGPYKASKKRVTHNQAALAAHIRANEEMRRMKALVGRGSRGFARLAKAESDQRRQLLANLNAS